MECPGPQHTERLLGCIADIGLGRVEQAKLMSVAGAAERRLLDFGCQTQLQMHERHWPWQNRLRLHDSFWMEYLCQECVRSVAQVALEVEVVAKESATEAVIARI